MSLHSCDVVPLLDAAVSETLATMFFSDAAPLEESEPASGMCSLIRFQGDASGWVSLSLAEEDARTLAANFLGLDEPDVSHIGVKAVCAEMANMICGSMLSMASPEGNFELFAPAVCTQGSADEGAASRSYATEAGRLCVSYRLSATTDVP